MKRLGIVISIAVVLCAAAPPTTEAAFSGTEVYLASIGGGPGAGGSQWYTTVWVHNPTASPALVQFSLLHRNQTNPAPIDVFNDTVAPGDTRRFDNAVMTMFGLDSAFGAIKVVSDQRLLVNSRIYNLPAGSEDQDSVGQFFAAVPAEFAIAAGQVTELLGVYQTQPSEDSQFRYNFGFVETRGGNVTVRVTAYNEFGTSLATRSYNLGPFEARQYPFANQFNDISSANVRLKVDVVSGSGRVVAFGSGLANASNDPSTFEMSFRDDLLADGQQGGGTITGVTAGMGLTGGGSTGTVTIDIGSGAGINVGTNSVAIADGGVSSIKLANEAVTAAKIANNSITSVKIVDGSITGADLANQAVTGSKVANGAIGNAQIASAAVTTAKIAEGAVARGRIADDAVDSTKIGDGAILTEDIAADAVTGAKVAVPLTLSGGATKVLELNNSSAGGISGATLRAINATSGSGIAGYLETSGTDATLVVENDGSGYLIKGFGSNGGSDEFHVENNGTIRQYNSSHSNTITLDASSGRGTFRDVRVTGHADATLPIAYAFIEGNTAQVRSGTSNVSCVWNDASDWYEITISGEDYYYRDYQTIVTTVGSSPAIPVTNQMGNDLVVVIYNMSGTKIKRDFQFVTFKGP